MAMAVAQRPQLKRFNLGSTYFNKITCFLQLLLNVSPTDDTDEYISTGGNVQKNPPATATKKE